MSNIFMDTKNREISSLVKAMKELKINEGTVITGETEAEEKINEKVIKFIPLWKWLIDQDK